MDSLGSISVRKEEDWARARGWGWCEEKEEEEEKERDEAKQVIRHAAPLLAHSNLHGVWLRSASGRRQPIFVGLWGKGGIGWKRAKQWARFISTEDREEY